MMVHQDARGETYMSAKEASDYTGLTRQTLDAYAKRGKLVKYKQGLARRVFFKKSELDALLEIQNESQQDS